MLWLVGLASPSVELLDLVKPQGSGSQILNNLGKLNRVDSRQCFF